ncbi:MAG: DEAD/DEAH box helicase [Psychrilyobacter sp.]|nr:DEAD/DEAH box helicase [Psychrilyobacter sp.]
MLFNELNLVDPILEVLKKKGYLEATAIQEQAIPYILEGRDLIGSSQTGTGKTAAFALPILNKLALDGKNKDLKALILAPTRELAIQIEEDIHTYGNLTKVTSTIIYGGVSPIKQIHKLKTGPNIIVATPGRLLDLISKGYLNLELIDQLVIDEADRMLDMGMIHEVRKIISKLPEKRQTMLFSATMPDEIKNLVSDSLIDPVDVSISPTSSTVDKVKQKIYLVDKGDKVALLQHLLKKEKISSAIIFARTKFRANDINELLQEYGYTSDVIHGERSQSARQRTIRDLKKGNIKFLVATDLASRGLDIDDLSHVINYDLTSIPETYVHRIGRTARAGSEGIALSFCDSEEKRFLRVIQKTIGKKIDVEKDHPYHLRDAKPTFADLESSREERQKKKYDIKGTSTGRKKTSRRGKKGPSRKPKTFKKGV